MSFSRLMMTSKRYGTWRTESDGFHVRRPRVRVPVHDRDCLPVHAGRPGDRDCLPVHAGHPGDRDRVPVDHVSSAIFPFFLTTRYMYRWRASIQQRMRRGLSYQDDSHVGSQGKLDHFKLTVFVIYVIHFMYKINVQLQGEDRSRFCFPLYYDAGHAHIPGPVDAWREIPVPVRDLLFDMFTRRYAFTRPEDLPRARAVWESITQTNLRKSKWEAWDKAMKTTGNRDPMAWLDYDPVWLRRDYWESLCEHWATGPWQERSQAAKRNRSTHPEKNVHTSGSVSYATHNQKLHHELERAPTFHELFDRTHKRKGTDDYVSESARTIAETYDMTMADRYVEGTPQPDLDPEAWVDAEGGPRKGRVYSFGDSLDTTLVLSSYASSVAPPAYASSSATPPISGVEEIRTLIREELREELRTHFGDIVQQLITALQGVRPSQPAPQVSITINFIYFE
ncbi:hypothetical protein Taro_006249 [Colocasia esculenta]|uniref:Uncharacterized protein n=1 Tax=Colocasia esculenta TaxID=4460 RepID=A0A843TWI2_COLES|nr:hypothetical protein [Colocasia esculenta]